MILECPLPLAMAAPLPPQGLLSQPPPLSPAVAWPSLPEGHTHTHRSDPQTGDARSTALGAQHPKSRSQLRLQPAPYRLPSPLVLGKLQGLDRNTLPPSVSVPTAPAPSNDNSPRGPTVAVHKLPPSSSRTPSFRQKDQIVLDPPKELLAPRCLCLRAD